MTEILIQTKIKIRQRANDLSICWFLFVDFAQYGLADIKRFSLEKAFIFLKTNFFFLNIYDTH